MLHNVFLGRLQVSNLGCPLLPIFHSLKKKKSWCTLLPDERKTCHSASVLWQLLMKLQCSMPLKKYSGYLGRRCVSRCYREMWLNVVLLILLVISAMPKHSSQFQQGYTSFHCSWILLNSLLVAEFVLGLFISFSNLYRTGLG